MTGPGADVPRVAASVRKCFVERTGRGRGKMLLDDVSEDGVETRRRASE